jgi:cyclopropane-fatty-acyl-phospholipid synthase
MIEKRILHQILLQIKHGALKVTYWDGTTVTYGSGTEYNHLKVISPQAVRAILRSMSVGFGESYMNGLIDIEGPIENISKLTIENASAFSKLSLSRALARRNINVRDRQKSQIQHHYDLGNDFYKMWLDSSLTYSCAYFRTPKDSLELAQQQKVDHILRKLQLKKGMNLLDIGSGWGTLLIKAAKEYGITGLGITLSQQQFEHSNKAAKAAGVDDKVRFELINYQDLAERDILFDRIVSVGMFEHVGRKNQDEYFKAVAKMLKPGAISVLHSITNRVETTVDPWIDKYIFPGGYIPATRQVVKTLPDHGFDLIDYENLRIHYAMTLEEWLGRFEKHKKEVLKMYDDRFYRMWRLYLGSSASSFRYGDLNLSQFVFTKGLNNTLPLTREFLYTENSLQKK